jgi:predicted DNA-binding transcriptional regulator YafY
VPAVRASRLLSILLLLQARGGLTAARLAAELEVSVRTIYRDIESLTAAGVPVYGAAGPAGGYRLVDGFRTRLTGLTAAEAEALFLAGVPAAAAELGREADAAATRRKLAAALPTELAERAEAAGQRVHLDAPGWDRESGGPEQLSAVSGAVWRQEPLRIRYRSWARVAEHDIEPYGVVLKAGTWYVVARVAEGGPRTFRVDRILRLERLAGRFERPDGFDLAAYWAGYVRRHRAGLPRGEAVVRLSPRGVERVRWDFAAEVAEAVAAGTAEADGWVRAVVPIESVELAEREWLRLGADVEVLTPAELRCRIADTARRLAVAYASLSSPG